MPITPLPTLPSMPPASKPSGFGTGNSFSGDKLGKALREYGVHDDDVKKIIADKAKHLSTGSSISGSTKADLAKKINEAKTSGEISSYEAERAKNFIRKMGK